MNIIFGSHQLRCCATKTTATVESANLRTSTGRKSPGWCARWSSLLGLFVVVMLASHARAATYCVDTTANTVISICSAVPGDCTLRGAMANANNGDGGSTQEIRVPTGTYALPGGLDFNPNSDKDDKTFSITGGWNAGCTSRTINSTNTVLNGENGATDATFSFLGNNKEMVVEALTFINFENFSVFDGGCADYNICPDTDTIRVRFNSLRNGRLASIFSVDAHLFTVQNNLFADIARDDRSPVSISYLNNETSPVISFNTFAKLNCLGSGEAAVDIASRRNGTTLHHNIFQSTGCSSDLFLSNDAGIPPVTLRNNLYNTRSGQAPSVQTNNVISNNPGFVNAAAGDYRLRETAPASAAINAGMTTLQTIQLGLSLPSQDLDGPAGLRVVGTRVDIGAYESAVNDASTLFVTNNADSGTGSLRQAVTSANASPGVQKIEFNLAGTCPQLILLQSPLPDITDSVEIDGYSQPGSSANTQSSGSDAELCLVLMAASGTLAQVLQVPDAAPSTTSLVVKGIAFAGATGFNGNFSVALRLRGGSNHLVQGNAFGGTGPGSIGSLGSPNFGIQVRGVAQNAMIGGPQPEHRNSFGNMMSSAIVLNDATSGNISGHTIQNNYIGLSAFGNVATPIGLNGIFASNSPNVSILDNVIVAVPGNAAIQITGASATFYRIRGNRIGITPYAIATAPFRVGTGILLTGGTGNHEIGDFATFSHSNTITNSDGAGIWLSPTAGNGTIIRPNRIYGNGISGVGMGIDLGDLGPLPNDPGDGDGGPNGGQNWPEVLSSVPGTNGTRVVGPWLNSTPSTQFLVDLYRSTDCAGGNRGGNTTTHVASFIVTTSAGGVWTLPVTVTGVGAPGYLTATATSIATGDTSEVGACYHETNDVIFANSFD